jgi:hypothetical protein
VLRLEILGRFRYHYENSQDVYIIFKTVVASRAVTGNWKICGVTTATLLCSRNVPVSKRDQVYSYPDWSFSCFFSTFRDECWNCREIDNDSSPRWWRQQGPLKRWYSSTRLHGSATQADSHLHIHRRENLNVRFYLPFMAIFQSSPTLYNLFSWNSFGAISRTQQNQTDVDQTKKTFLFTSATRARPSLPLRFHLHPLRGLGAGTAELLAVWYKSLISEHHRGDSK